MSLKIFITISLLFAASSGIEVFSQDPDIVAAQAAAASISPNVLSNPNPLPATVTDLKLDLNYQNLLASYLQATWIVNGFNAAIAAHSSGSMTDSDFSRTVLSMIPEPFSGDLADQNIANIYAGLLSLYSSYVSTAANIILKVVNLNQSFAAGTITMSQYLTSINKIYRSNSDILDFTFFYYLQKNYINQLDSN